MGRPDPGNHLRLVATPAVPDGADAAVRLPCADRDFLDIVFLKNRGALRRHLHRFVANRDDAEEILQEAYVRFAGRENLDAIEANARAYLFRIATNLVNDHLRRRRVQAAVCVSPVEDIEELAGTVCTATQVDGERAVESVYHSLMELAPRDRAIFVMHRFQDMSCPEIAREIGVSARTVERSIGTTLEYCRVRLGRR
ncbi:MAG: sigma-70 family RNA polymerase sigma factor [Gammaproteobacteria bacterium]|nr:sigma-70 family RNA polymerase sigma factor [Gammaproteobacteria bacterium]